MVKKGLNLIREQLEPPTTWDRFYKWLLSTARVIMIIVEVVVMVAFGIRILVDTRGGQLDEEIESVKDDLTGYKDLESQFREIQAKTDVYRQLWEASSNKSLYVGFINNIISTASGEISITYTNEDIVIRGTLPVNDINRIETQLKSAAESVSSPVRIRKVELLEVNTTSAAQQTAEFTIRIEIIAPDFKRNFN